MENDELKTRKIKKPNEFWSIREICIDCEKEGFEVEIKPIENLGQWTYLYECPRCHRTTTDIDFIGMKADGVL